MNDDAPTLGERKLVRHGGVLGGGPIPEHHSPRPSDPYSVMEWDGRAWVEIARVKGFDAAKAALALPKDPGTAHGGPGQG